MSWYPTEAERASVQLAAERAGISLSEFQRACILAQGAPIVRTRIPPEDLACRKQAAQALDALAAAVVGKSGALDVLAALFRIERQLAGSADRPSERTQC